jgi:hypothetical protein
MASNPEIVNSELRFLHFWLCSPKTNTFGGLNFGQWAM